MSLSEESGMVCKKCHWNMQEELDDGFLTASRSLHPARDGGMLCSQCPEENMAKDPSRSKTYRCDVIKILVKDYGMAEAEAFDLLIKHKDEVERGIALASFPRYIAQQIHERK